MRQTSVTIAVAGDRVRERSERDVRKWIRNLGVLAGIAVVSAGCSAVGTAGLDVSGASSTRAPDPVVTTTPSKPYLTVTPTLELTDRTTKPGTKLKFGQQAVIPFYSLYDKTRTSTTCR
ncbi:hypothetical protein [Amycolatopsis acididurans]|uniref:hypothetical protein n=1 Tax=Amycolatopsis acididurans TaxID=2724524 RepID=UPI001FE44A51|nr:hypothetical protein [Amycolatopsis acididurans]